MLKTAQETAQSYEATSPKRAKRLSPVYKPQEDAEEQSDDDFGPAPPTNIAQRRGQGPTVPKLDDLTYRNEMRDEDTARAAHALQIAAKTAIDTNVTDRAPLRPSQ